MELFIAVSYPFLIVVSLMCRRHTVFKYRGLCVRGTAFKEPHTRSLIHSWTEFEGKILVFEDVYILLTEGHDHMIIGGWRMGCGRPYPKLAPTFNNTLKESFTTVTWNLCQGCKDGSIKTTIIEFRTFITPRQNRQGQQITCFLVFWSSIHIEISKTILKLQYDFKFDIYILSILIQLIAIMFLTEDILNRNQNFRRRCLLCVISENQFLSCWNPYPHNCFSS